MRLVFRGRLPGTNEIVAANRGYRYAGASQKKKAQKELCQQWAGQIRQRFKAPVIIRVMFYEKDMRRDDDNVFGGLKFILDALQECGVIADDSPRWCHVLPERFVDRGDPRIEVFIEERSSEND